MEVGMWLQIPAAITTCSAHPEALPMNFKQDGKGYDGDRPLPAI